MTVQAFFLPATTGQRFCLYHRADGRCRERGAVVFVHAFAEEMNKSRRMAALQSRVLALAGYSVLQMDLLGCGDSTGDFADSTWEEWLEDVGLACAWLRQRSGAPLWLWGLRAGCLVAAAAARELPEPANFLFWQPVASGKVFLQQFLRLKMAGALLEGESRGVTQALRQQLAAGEAVEVAGYVLPAALARGLEAADLSPVPGAGRLEWLEVSAQADGELSPVSRKCVAAWEAAGHPSRSRVIPGQPFWQTVEIAECPALIAATLVTLEEDPQA